MAESTDATAASDLLAAVERSPRAAAAHDRAGWVALFTADGRVEDPVGSRPHIGHRQIGRFYDTFIGPRDITFHRDLDIVSGSSVIRDLELEVAMGPSVTMHIPAFLRYDLRRVQGEWLLTRLRAYWELPAMVGQFIGNGPAALPAAAQLSAGLLRNQRPAGAIGFATGFRRAGARTKRRAAELVSALSAGRVADMPVGVVTEIGENRVTPTELVAALRGARATKLINSGSTVVTSVDDGNRRGVLFVDVARRRGPITEIRYFPGSAGEHDGAESG